jgi:CRISPR-associated protein Csc1
MAKHAHMPNTIWAGEGVGREMNAAPSHDAAASVRVRRCRLTLHDGVYFATREMGTLVETERYLHNYALSYALFQDVIRTPYYAGSHRPTYASDLELLNQADVYVTPARPLDVQYQLVTYKVAQTTYHQRAQQFEPPNYPRNIGRVKELAPGGTFEFWMIGTYTNPLPHWIRLGKWSSKAEVVVVSDAIYSTKSGTYTCAHPLNPLDLGSNEMRVFNLISMPPASLLSNAVLTGTYIQSEDTLLPYGMRYTFPTLSNGETKRGRR